MELIAKIEVKATQTQWELLCRTANRYNEACNWLSAQAFQSNTFGKPGLQKNFYYALKENFALSAQMALLCIYKVADAYKSSYKKKKREKVCQVRSLGSMSYDDRVLSYNVAKNTVSIWTLEGRQTLSFLCGNHQKSLLKTRHGQSKLLFVGGKLFLLPTCQVASTPIEPTQHVLGVDMGIENIATDSDGNMYGQSVRKRRRRFHQTRRSLQKKGSKSAKRKLKRRSKKEKRFIQDVNHCISKQLVKLAKRTKRAIAMENLSGIRSRTRALPRDLRRELNSWAFFDLQQKVEYKALLNGVASVSVSPAYTSQTCSLCGHCEKANRRSQSEFVCRACGAQLHADRNAACNIASRGVVSLPVWRPVEVVLSDVRGMPNLSPASSVGAFKPLPERSEGGGS